MKLLRGCALAFLLASSAYSESAEAVRPTRSISTSGNAVVYVVPDEAVITFGVEKSNAELDAATSASEEASQQLVKAIEAFQIEPRHLATDNLQVSLKYENDGRKISAYIVTRQYMVTLKDLKKLNPLVNALLKNGANQFQGVQFRSTELRAHRDKARSMAIKAAKEKAEALAGELDCNVGAPSSISESADHWSWSRSSLSFNNAMHVQNVSQEIAGPSAEGGETLPLGQIAVQATVSVTFDLVPR